MGKGQKIITAALWGVLVLAMVGVAAAKFLLPRGGSKPADVSVHAPQPHPTAELGVLFKAARFALTDQDGKDFSSGDLRGRPYVAAFIFTQCAGVCPRMTTTMAGLQKQLPTDVHLVS